MKCLSIQLQSHATDIFLAEDLIRLVKSIGRYPELDRDEANDNLLVLNFFTEELPALWADIQTKVLADNTMAEWIKSSTIIVCEGDNEWQDYLLLSHFDESEKFDHL